MEAYVSYARSYKGYRISYWEGSHWSISRSVPGKFFDKVEYIAYLGSERACVDFINNMK